ncbi:MAG: S41 family peptidase, partial [Caldilineaceae bacterium]|nr:S41 family peptidase [Caldilineaceae bacterium]
EDGLPIIVAPFDGSPAAQAGVKAGDIIVNVDGEDVSGLSISAIAEKIRGPEGTEVTLTLFRRATEESLDITIVRGEINIPAVDWTMIPETKIGLLRLTRFSANAKDEVVDALDKMEGAGAEGLIVDLRNNPGGLLTQAVSVTSQFLTDGNVLQQEDAQGNREPFPVEPGGVAPTIPMVVLTNPGTASSSEIFAGAIQDHKRGMVIGETTFGTGTVLQTYGLSDGSALLLGTSQWLTADGRLIRKQGITPDMVVELGPDGQLLSPNEVEEMTQSELAASGDAQLLAALKELGITLTAEE